MRSFFYTLLLVLISYSAIAQNYAEGCDGIRYAAPIFTEISKTTVKYASSTPENQELFMDIYQPSNDLVTKRPLVLLAHGGGFLFGDKADMDAFCQFFAQRGFVTATMQYRLFAGFPTPTTMIDIASKAVSDMKGAYRFFKSDAANQNIYKIDTTKIFIGGYSAGSITALLAAYMDSGDPIDSTVLSIIEANGGFAGNTGDQENRTHVDNDIFGVFNMSGAVFTKRLLDPDEPFLMSFHGDKDQTVPIDSNSVFFGLAYLYGSRTIHNEADKIGLPNTLTVAVGGDHSDIYTDPKFANDLNSFTQNSLNLYYPRLCGINLKTKYDDRPPLNVMIYPNPSSEILNIDCSDKIDEIWLMSSKGNITKRLKSLSRQNEISVKDLTPGQYYLIPIKENKAFKPLPFQIVR
ncbi:MAG: alpha/beta hydrolase [Saprospiraceae bacterium]|nr:alpha/beta hydrolase [Saprospiraceae bacterium]